MKVALFLLCVGVALASPSRPFFGVSNQRIPIIPSSEKIVGGQDAEVGEYPWQISLQVKPLLSARYHTCGGTLISEKYVVCAAHCVKGQTLSRLSVVVGAHNVKDETESTQQRVSVKSFTFNPDYNANTIVNDISIIELASPVTLNDRVQPLRVAPSKEINPEGSTCINTGWGNSRENGGTPAIVPDVLQEVELEILPKADCVRAYSGINVVGDGMICGHDRSGGKGACNGDSGGPLVCSDADGPYLAGIVSWGMQPCAQAAYPSVYTRVSEYLDFIQEYTP